MKDPVDRAIRAIARRNSYALVWARFGVAHPVMLGGLALREGANLAGEALEVSVMFLDIRDFTAFSERAKPEEVVAVSAALEIGQPVRSRYAGRLGVGIGVNSGPVVAGTVGGGGRVEFAVIGDTVNTASRVEAATRETGDDVLITDATRVLAGDELFAFEFWTSVKLKGKRDPVTLWAPRLATPDLAPICVESTGHLALPNAPLESTQSISPTQSIPH